MYYLQSRYYDPTLKRFINADGFVSTGRGFLGYNMFAYCRNSPVLFKDQLGSEPTSSIDINGDGEDDCFVYEYTQTIIECYGDLSLTREVTGNVYIFTGVPESFFEDESNWPANFNYQNDLLVADYTDSSNPNMYAYQAQKLRIECRPKVINCLLQYDNDFNTSWNRTRKSLTVEWRAHMWFGGKLGVKRAQNIDFDNKEEGKNYKYFFKKAIDALIK